MFCDGIASEGAMKSDIMQSFHQCGFALVVEGAHSNRSQRQFPARSGWPFVWGNAHWSAVSRVLPSSQLSTHFILEHQVKSEWLCKSYFLKIVRLIDCKVLYQSTSRCTSKNEEKQIQQWDPSEHPYLEPYLPCLCQTRMEHVRQVLFLSKQVCLHKVSRELVHETPDSYFVGALCTYDRTGICDIYEAQQAVPYYSDCHYYL